LFTEAACVCATCRLHSPAKASSELKSILDQFREEQDYDKAYRRLIRTDCMAPHLTSKSKQQMSALKEHVRNSVNLWARKLWHLMASLARLCATSLYVLLLRVKKLRHTFSLANIVILSLYQCFVKI